MPDCSTEESSIDVLTKVLRNVAISTQEQLYPFFFKENKKIIVLSGPTGIGKTALSLKIAERLNVEIVSADSIQVYRGMDIGTAKASLADREKVPHHLIDIRDVQEPFNVKDFHDEAYLACRNIFLRGNVPLVVGGTGFYIHAFLYGPPEGPGADLVLRNKLHEQEEKFGIERLYERLYELDPLYAKTITQNDRHKIIRALEIIELSGKKVSDFSWSYRPIYPYFNFRCWFIYRPREELYPLLEKRSEEMLEQGLVQEVIRLDEEGIRTNKTAAQAIGYRQTLTYLDTKRTQDDYNDYVLHLKQASRHLAKRQFTWFRKEPGFNWIDCSTYDLDAIADMIVEDYERN